MPKNLRSLSIAKNMRNSLIVIALLCIGCGPSTAQNRTGASAAMIALKSCVDWPDPALQAMALNLQNMECGTSIAIDGGRCERIIRNDDCSFYADGLRANLGQVSGETNSEFMGEWIEEWPGRRCKDVAHIRVASDQLSISMADCSDGEQYVVSEVVSDAQGLKFKLHTPSTNTTLQYDLRWNGQGFNGQVTGTERFSVQWKRKGDVEPNTVEQNLDIKTVLGRWAEQWPNRECHDIAEVTQVGGQLSISMNDCTDGEKYKINQIRLSGSTLRFHLLTPSTGNKLQYILNWDGTQLKGLAQGNKRNQITWVRHTGQVPQVQPANPAKFVGTWAETWPNRQCHDVAHVTANGRRLQISMSDCTDGEQYQASEIAFRGDTLSFKLLTPSNGNVLKYRLKLDGTSLRGNAVGNNNTPVVWNRQAQNAPRAQPTPPTDASKLVGSWTEDWPNRKCKDIANLTNRGGQIQVTMADCTDGEQYKASNISYDGTTLSFALLTPSTGVSLQYTLRWNGSLLTGSAVGKNNTPVTWTHSSSSARPEPNTGPPNDPSVLVGQWSEQWPDRRCTDVAKILVRNGNIRISMSDCSDGEVYKISEVTFVNKVLRFKLLTPSSGSILQYTMQYDGRVLKGTAVGNNTNQITWSRSSAQRPPGTQPTPSPASGGGVEIEYAASILKGAWGEDWPNRRCEDEGKVRVRGERIRVSLTDCSDGESMKISNVKFENNVLSFALKVPSTGNELFYSLKLEDRDTMRGRVTGSNQAQITWRRRVTSAGSAKIKRSDLSGEWTEHWSEGNRRCNDVSKIKVQGRKIKISMSDCTDGETYRITQTRFRDNILKFKLHTPSTSSDLYYELRPSNRNTLTGQGNNGDKRWAITWTRNQ